MVEQMTPTQPASADRLTRAIDEIVASTQCERRSEQRFPYFAAVSLTSPDAPRTRISAFAKDISLSGIGLVHVMPLAKGPVEITMPLPSGKFVTIRTDICWCRDFGGGWYISGGRFLELVG